MTFQPTEYTATEIDAKDGIVWTCDDTMPGSLRGTVLHSGVPCFLGHIDHQEPAVKFAIPKGRTDYLVVRLAGRPGLARLAESYRPATDSPPDDSWVPEDSIRGRLIEQARDDPFMPQGLKKAIRDPRRNWSSDEDADYLIHGVN
jgi:hypothetical protein